MTAEFDQFSDAELILEARNPAERSPAAFGELYRRHRQMVLGYFVSRCRGDVETAGDLTAETFARALEGLGGYDPARGEPRAWLFGIARNVIGAYQTEGFRMAEVRRRLGIRVDLVDLAAAEEIERVVDRLVGAELLGLVDDLPAGQAEAIRLRVHHGADAATIGDTMGLSTGNARVLIHRALRGLRGSR